MADSVEAEKLEVARMRHEEGLTLQEIAIRLGKSIYWVNSRLNPNYEPKRKRRIAQDDDDSEGMPVPDNQELAAEVDRVSELRRSDLTYEQIANRLNRSVYWVHSRLRRAYQPRKTRDEKLFQESRVVPFLETLGHLKLQQYQRIEGPGFSQEADIVSTLDGKVYVTEVKLHLTHHQLQTAIGQLVLHRLLTVTPVLLQIALPNEVGRNKLAVALVSSLKAREGINIIFVP
jgi:hypothetical protein